MNSVTINGTEYEVPELTFDAICQLEESGVNLLGMNRKNMKIASLIRGLVAWIMDVEPEVASMEIQQHIENGGNIYEIISAVTSELNNSGFFGGNSTERRQEKAVPMDHRKPQRRKNTVPSRTS